MSSVEASLGLAPGELRLETDHAVWAQAFAEERGRIDSRIAPASLHHTGSTAVPGLPAKPILDMTIIAPSADHDRIAGALVTLGYHDRDRRPGGGGHVLIRTRSGLRTHNLHLFDTSDPEGQDHLDFTAALRANPAARRAYAARKAQLIADPSVSRAAYVVAKGETVAAILRAWRAR